MPGIYLHFRPSGLDDHEVQDFARRFETRVGRRPVDRVDHVHDRQLRAAAVDHGHWPSGGVASGPAGRLLVAGSCWRDAESTSLMDTAEALAEFAARLEAGDREPLRGLHVLAHQSKAGDRLVVENDRFGSMPLYYREDGRGGIKVASELKFLVDPGRERPDLAGLADLLAISYHVRAATPVAGITRLPLHHRLEYDVAGLRIARLPQPGYPRDLAVDRESLAELDRLAGLYFRRLAAHQPRLSIALSGGLDSRLLLYSARQAGLDLVGFASGEPGNIDVREACRLAEHVGLPIVPYEVDGRRFPEWFEAAVWLTEGRTPANHLHYMPALLDGITPAEPQINGVIGEAAVGGYLEHAGYRQATAAEQRRGCLEFARKSALYWPKNTRESVMSSELRAETLGAHEKATHELLGTLGFRGGYSDYLDFRFIYRGGLFGVPAFVSQVSPLTDVVSPFLDADFFDLGARLRSDDLAHRSVQLRWGLECMPGFDDLPRVKDGLLLPVRDDDPDSYDRALRRRSRLDRLRYAVVRLSGGRVGFRIPHGFPHYGGWYRRWPAVRNYVDGILLDERTAERGFWQPDGLQQLLKMLRGGRNLWSTVGGILMIEVLCRQLLDGDVPVNPALADAAFSSHTGISEGSR